MKPSSANLRGDFIRPASLTYRFDSSSDGAYREAAINYKTLLGAKEAPEQHEQAGYSFYQFQVNQAPNPKQAVELRLERREKDIPQLQNRLIMYWAIDLEDLPVIKEKLIKLGYHMLEEDTVRTITKVGYRFIAESPAGNLLAGHTNPPFPFIGSLHHPGRNNAYTSINNSSTQVLAGVSLAVALLGTVVLFRRR